MLGSTGVAQGGRTRRTRANLANANWSVDPLTALTDGGTRVRDSGLDQGRGITSPDKQKGGCDQRTRGHSPPTLDRVGHSISPRTVHVQQPF